MLFSIAGLDWIGKVPAEAEPRIIYDSLFAGLFVFPKDSQLTRERVERQGEATCIINVNRKFLAFPTTNQTWPAMGIAWNQDIVELRVALELKAFGLRIEIVLLWSKNRGV